MFITSISVYRLVPSCKFLTSSRFFNEDESMETYSLSFTIEKSVICDRLQKEFCSAYSKRKPAGIISGEFSLTEKERRLTTLKCSKSFLNDLSVLKYQSG